MRRHLRWEHTLAALLVALAGAACDSGGDADEAPDDAVEPAPETSDGGEPDGAGDGRVDVADAGDGTTDGVDEPAGEVDGASEPDAGDDGASPDDADALLPDAGDASDDAADAGDVATTPDGTEDATGDVADATDGGGPAVPCETPEGEVIDCDDGDPCTVDTCTDEGTCTHEMEMPEGGPTPECPSTWLPPGLSLDGPCEPAEGTCELAVEDGSEVLTNLQRIYRGASTWYATPHADGDGYPAPHRFPSSQGVTPVEGTCCSSNGLGGPDEDGNDQCDHQPNMWNTPTWANLGFMIGDNDCIPDCTESYQHHYVYAFDSEGTGGDASFTARARWHTGCYDADCTSTIRVSSVLADDRAVEPASSVEGTLDAGGVETCVEGCTLAPPETLSYELSLSCGDDPTVLEGTIELTPSQREGFEASADLAEAYPKLEEPLARTQELVEATVAHYQADAPDECQFPKAQGITPVEGTCCSSSGLGGPDEDGNDQCDAQPSIWDTETWNALDFVFDTQHRFVYSVQREEGPSGHDQLAVRAQGDLDCDGQQSTFRRVVFAPDDGGAESCSASEQPPDYFERIEVEWLDE